MSYGAGHVMDMINRMKQNRAQRPSNRSKFNENNREGIYSSEIEPERPTFKIVPEQELNEIKKRIRERAKSEQKRQRIFYGIVLLCILIISIWLILWLN